MDEDAQSRRRRGAGVVTANACTECRKKRSKCDGNAPCQRCAVQKVECIYSIPERQSKGNMRAEIKELTRHREQSERVFSAMAGGDRAQETINRLRNGETLEAVSAWLEITTLDTEEVTGVTTYSTHVASRGVGKTLRMAESAGTYALTGRSNSSEDPSSTGRVAWSAWNSSDSSRHNSTSLHTNEGEDAMNWESTGRHTSQAGDSRNSDPELPVTYSPLASRLDSGFEDINSADLTDDSLQTTRGQGQNHILAPTYEGEGIEDPNRSWTNITSDRGLVQHLMALYFCWEYPTFASLSKEHFLTDFLAGRSRYCSPILVNAMLALGCRFSSIPESRSDPENGETSGDHFFAEAKRLLVEDDHKSLPTLQALGLLAIREASCGRDNESIYYGGQAIRLAVEFGLHTEVTNPDKASDGGMDHEVRAATFWGAFALDQAWSLTVGRLSHFSRSPNLIAKPKIVQAIEISEWIPYTDGGASKTKIANQPSNVRSVYKCFCELSELVHQSLYTLYAPVMVTSQSVTAIYTRFLNWYNDLPVVLKLGTNFTPSVLFVHMYYHYAILMLFRPFIKLRFIGSGVSPASVSAQAADAISTLVRSYDQLYTLQRIPSFVPYITFASGVTHLALGRDPSPTSKFQSVHDLKDMCSRHGFCDRGLHVLRILTQKWQGDQRDMPWANDDDGYLQEAMETCKPTTKLTNRFCPDMLDTFEEMQPRGRLALFSPFPMQGVPLLAAEEDLAKYGFARADVGG